MAVLGRQKVLLYFLWRAGGSASHIKATKWCFLLREASPSGGGSAFYGFVPYKYGPFSFSLFHEVGRLASLGLVEEPSSQTWMVTQAGIQEASTLARPLRNDIDSILSRYGALHSGDLVDVIYRDFPWFTMNSERAERRAVKRPRADPRVYTMGYQGLLVDDFLNHLLQRGIHDLIDVRSNPVARRYGFHASSLSRLCGRLGIGYQHFPHLGVPSMQRRDLTSRSDYDALFTWYRNTVLSGRESLVAQVAAIMESSPSVLVCNEADPRLCHRSHLADRIGARIGKQVQHLGWPR